VSNVHYRLQILLTDIDENIFVGLDYLFDQPSTLINKMIDLIALKIDEYPISIRLVLTLVERKLEDKVTSSQNNLIVSFLENQNRGNRVLGDEQIVANHSIEAIFANG
jgi:hypothetical protein